MTYNMTYNMTVQINVSVHAILMKKYNANLHKYFTVLFCEKLSLIINISKYIFFTL